MFNVALGAVVWLILGVLVGLAFGAAESLGGKREVLGVLKWRWQPVALLLLAALLLSGCASYTKALYGEGPASADYTRCMNPVLEAFITPYWYIDSCMKKAGWERLPGQHPEGPGAFRRIEP